MTARSTTPAAMIPIITSVERPVSSSLLSATELSLLLTAATEDVSSDTTDSASEDVTSDSTDSASELVSSDG